MQKTDTQITYMIKRNKVILGTAIYALVQLSLLAVCLVCPREYFDRILYPIVALCVIHLFVYHCYFKCPNCEHTFYGFTHKCCSNCGVKLLVE